MAAKTSEPRCLPLDDENVKQRDDHEQLPNVDRGWAWVIVVTAFYIHFLAAGAFMCFGALYVELLDYFQESRSISSLIASVAGISCAISGPLSSTLTTRYGHRTTVMLGSLLSTVGLLASGWAPNIYFLIVSYGLLVGCGCGLCWITYIVAVTGYFKKKRGIAQGLAFCGGGTAYIVYPLLYRYLFQKYTWRGASWIMAAMWANGCVSASLLRPVPIRTVSSGSKSSHKSVLRKWTFYLFIVAHFCFHMDMIVFVTILPDHARQTGHSPYYAGLLLTILGAPIIPVRIVGNMMIDRRIISPPLYMCILCLCMSLTAFMFPLCDAYWYEALVSGLRGSVMAILTPLATNVCAEVFSAERMAAAFGLVVMAGGMAGLIGPALAGYTFDMTGSYLTIYMIQGVLSLVAMVLIFLIYLYRAGRLGNRQLTTAIQIDDQIYVDDQEKKCLNEISPTNVDATAEDVNDQIASSMPNLQLQVLLGELQDRDDVTSDI